MNILEEIKNKLTKIKSKADTAKAQEKYLLKQLKDNFECESIEEASELIETLITEKEDIDKTIKEKTNIIIRKMEEKGFL